MHQKQPPANVAWASSAGGGAWGTALRTSRDPLRNQSTGRASPTENTHSRSFMARLRY